MVKRYHSALARRLGQNIACYRRRAKLTQEQLAEAIQVETLTVSRYERGTALPSLVTLETLSVLLRISVTDLLADEGNTQAEPMPVFPRSEEGEQFLVILESLPSDERSAVMDVLKTLAGFLRKKGSRSRKVPKASSRKLERQQADDAE
jgi:transcriptional regulator with XRE-family HTH domain